MPSQYPSITEASLTPFRAVEIQLHSNPGFLDDPACPYPPSTKAMLRRLTGAEPAAATGTDLTDPAEAKLDEEIANLFRTVKRDSDTYTGSDMKDKMSFLKTATDLLSRLIDLQSKRFNIRNMARAQRAFVEVLEEFMTPAQRTEIISKLEGYIDVQ